MTNTSKIGFNCQPLMRQKILFSTNTDLNKLFFNQFNSGEDLDFYLF